MFKQNYEYYTLEELVTALENIDGLEQPEQVILLKELIKKGGYKVPKQSINQKIHFTNKYFKYFLIGWFLISSFGSFLSLYSNVEFLVVFSAIFNSSMLVTIVTRHSYFEILFYMWCGFIAVAGAAGLITALSSSEVSAVFLIKFIVRYIFLALIIFGYKNTVEKT